MQPTQLYLDTARLGRMSPRAGRAHADFARLAADEGGSLFFERFLRSGAEAWPESVRTRYPGLADWQGIGPLKASLRHLTGSRPDLPVLLANRTAQIMKLAARLLFGQCRNVLITDLGWPPYHEMLATAADRTGRRVSMVRIKSGIMEGGWNEADVMRVVLDHFVREKCDGLFLCAVSNLGVRLPAESIIRCIEGSCALRFAVIDGAQEFCHVPTDLRTEHCDLYMTGCHKWLGGGHPMGLGFYGRRCSQGMIETILARLLAAGKIDDPLLRFSTQLETGELNGQAETVTLVPLFSSHGASMDAMTPRSSRLATQLANASAVFSVACLHGWKPMVPAEPLRTGIVMLEAMRPNWQRLPASALREHFAGHGIALTAYDDSVVRLSLPEVPWRTDDLDLLAAALAS